MKHSLINKPHFEKMTWSHFWDYYKFHVIFGIFSLFLIGTIIYSVLSNKSPDLTIHFIGSPPVQENTVEPLLEVEFKEQIEDANQDGTIKIDVLVKNLSTFHLSEEDKQDGGIKIIEWDNEPTDADLLYIEKITLDLTTGEPALYIIDKGIMEVYMTQGVFAPLESINLPGSADTITGESELDPGYTHTYGISLANNAFMQKLGIDAQNKYIGVRVINEGQEDDETMRKNYENAMCALKYILEYK